MIFCHCASVTESAVERTIADGATTVAEVTRRCGAGQHCGPCREEIAAMLYAEQSKRQNPASAANCNRCAA
jgi:bacterioferritin-associated ferredoxin